MSEGGLNFHQSASQHSLRENNRKETEGVVRTQNIYISIDILLIMTILQKKSENIFARSPTLDTVLMIEKSIDKYSGEFNKTELWKKLPKKVMWQTYLLVLDYLENINKIAFDRNGTIGYIWNPALSKILSKRKELKL